MVVAVAGVNGGSLPRAVYSAKWLLLIWTAWTTGIGIFQSWVAIPALVTDQLAGLVAISPDTLHEIIVVFYGIAAILSVWIIWRIGAGRRWARSSLLFSFVVDAIWTLAPPYHGFGSYLLAVSDLGLQAIAIYLLYASPGRAWFEGPIHTLPR